MSLGLAAFASHHLVQKKRSGKVTDAWLRQAETYLARAVAHFGGNRELMSIQVQDVLDWVHAIRVPDAKGKLRRPSPGTLRHHINALSNLYERAKSENVVVGSYNPVSNIMRGEKPTARTEEAEFLEQHEAAALLEAARVGPKRPDIACPFLYPLLATFLITGGRKTEVRGLEVEDISFDRKTVSFRPNKWRRLKTRHSVRTA